MKIERFVIYLADLNPTIGEMSKVRPVVVVSMHEMNTAPLSADDALLLRQLISEMYGE